MKNTRAIAQFPFCADDPRYAGMVEVVQVSTDQNKTVGMRLRVGDRPPIQLPRNRADEVIAAIMAATDEASKQYQQLIEEMNRHE